MPQKYKPLQVIQDEEYILSQTPQKQKHLGHLSSTGHQNSQDILEKQVQSDKVQRWFNAEYFYSQMDKAYFAS